MLTFGFHSLCSQCFSKVTASLWWPREVLTKRGKPPPSWEQLWLFLISSRKAALHILFHEELFYSKRDSLPWPIQGAFPPEIGGKFLWVSFSSSFWHDQTTCDFVAALRLRRDTPPPFHLVALLPSRGPKAYWAFGYCWTDECYFHGIVQTSCGCFT